MSDYYPDPGWPATLETFPLLAHAGEPMPEFHCLATKQEMEAYVESTEWGEIQLDGGVNLMLAVNRSHPDVGEHWNPLTDVIRPMVRDIVPARLDGIGLSKAAVDSICSDLLIIVGFSAFRDVFATYDGLGAWTDRPITWFTDLRWEVYQAGHMPCGWNGEFSLGHSARRDLVVW